MTIFLDINMQTYKKVLLFLMIICTTFIFSGCHRKLFPIFHRNRSEQFSASKQFQPYNISKSETPQKKTLSRVERKQNRKAERAKRQALRAQERGRKEHIKKQNPKVQERMKKSLEESEKTRKRETLWQRVKSWIKHKQKEKK